jgi:hypothetical protein
MTVRDNLGHTVTGATPGAVQHYETALRQFQCYIGDPVATVDLALQESPDFVMAHVLRAYLHLLGTEPEAIAIARQSHRAAAALLPGNRRERGHVEAIGHLVDGRWRAAGRTLEDVSIDHPLDVLALQAGHLSDFYTGASRMLRDRIARALPAWEDDMPGHHAVLGMYAFGAEENGDYATAEAYGRRAVDSEPRDGWSWHAVAHVMEMQGRQRDGINWLRADPKAWSEDSFFRVHIWWHLALYHLDLGEINEVLALFDGPIYGERSPIVLDMIDASALLWRLHLRGVDVGHRWNAVADNWEPLADAGNYAFNDAHAAMAFVGAGRGSAVDRILEAQSAAMKGSGDNVIFTGEVGAPVTLAIRAFADEDYDEVVRLLRPVRNIAQRFGGSHAQRDLLDLTLIEAAFRSGQSALAKALAAERMAMKPTSPLSRLFVERATAATKTLAPLPA